METPYNTDNDTDSDDSDVGCCNFSNKDGSCDHEPIYLCHLCKKPFCDPHYLVWNHECPQWDAIIDREDDYCRKQFESNYSDSDEE